MATATKQIYCARCRADVDHSMTLDKNREIVATCSRCGGNLKFPMTATSAELDGLIAANKKANVGQITVEMAAADQAKHDAAFLKLMGVQG